MVDNNRKLKKIFDGVYNDKAVFVTGHTGFKGAWLTIWLELLGAKVTGYSLAPPTNPSLFDVANIENKMRNTIADIRDYNQLCQAITKSKPEIVFHLAAQSIVRQSYEEPRETYETNVMGTANVLEAVRNCPSVKSCVIITSDKCYENNEWEYSYRENDPMGGHDPYSSSKGCAELITSAYQRSFFSCERKLGLVSMRSGNVIGGGDWAQDRIIPDCVRAIVSDKPIVVRNPSSIRPWQHVLDPLSAYLSIGSQLFNTPDKFVGGWNIGPSVNTSKDVKSVVEDVINIWGDGKWHNASSGKSHHEARTLRLNCEKAANLLSWTPCYDTQKAVESTMQWYRGYYKNPEFNAYQYTVSQIVAFVTKANSENIAWSKINVSSQP